MVDNWIPVRERQPEDEQWKIVMTSDGTRFPARFKNKQWQMWSSLPSSGLVEQLFHGKVAYWQEPPEAYPYVQCKCGTFYLQAEGRKECPICASFHPKKQKKETPPETETPPTADVPTVATTAEGMSSAEDGASHLQAEGNSSTDLFLNEQ